MINHPSSRTVYNISTVIIPSHPILHKDVLKPVSEKRVRIIGIPLQTLEIRLNILYRQKLYIIEKHNE